MTAKSYAVFLSFNSEDRADVETFAHYLLDKAKLRPWFDQWDLVPGEDWIDGLDRGLAESATCAVFVGKSGEGPWQKREVKTALIKQTNNPNFRVIPVLLPDAPKQPELPSFLPAIMWVDFRSKRLDDDDALWRLECGILGQSPGCGRPRAKTPETIPQKPSLGPIVYKLCNRDDQENDFLKFFIPKFKGNSRQPQFYFVHGDNGEGHESFIERINKTHIKNYVEEKYGGQYADVYAKTVTWPTRGDVETRQADLTLNFIKTFEQLDATPEDLANSLSQLMVFQKHPLVSISHNIYTYTAQKDAPDAPWDARSKELLCWYIKECWANLECHDDTPQFLIFLNIIYPGTSQLPLRQRIFPWRHYSKKQIFECLCQIHTSSGDPDPCQLIEELRSVTRIDVQEWFSKFDIYEDEWRRLEQLNAIFKERVQLRMADVEHHLKMIVEEYTREKVEF